jgi:hypothetical protein
MIPLIFSTSGGEGKEAGRYHKYLAALIAEKRGKTMGYVGIL